MALTAEDIEHLSDPVWRLSNLYMVKNARGEIVPFVPSDEQLIIIRAVYVEGKKKIIILKARQLGMSTVIDIMAADKTIWERGIQAAIVDLTQSDASKKLENKVRLAWDNLPADIRSMFVTGKDSDKRWQIKLKADKAWNEIQAGMNARGDTFQFLHISEWGAIQFEDEQRSVEISTGALPAAKEGIVIIESTYKGGKSGPFWEIIDRALKVRSRPEDRTEADYTVYFFPWFTDKSYHLEGRVEQIDAETTEYLDGIEVETGTTLLPSQRLWYFKEAMSLGFFRFREMPSTLEECFKGNIEGAVYQEFVMKAQAQGRVSDFSISESNLTHTVWDLGSPFNTSTWFFQFHGNEIHFVDLICEEPMTLVERVGLILSKPYQYGIHLYPHDSVAQEKSGKNFVEQVFELGLRNGVVALKPSDIWPGINTAHQMFSRFHFHSENCKRGIEALECYRTKKDKVNNYITERPVHDWSSHIADPIRVLAESEEAGIFSRMDQTAVQANKRRVRRRTQARTS
tara:strand:- start:13798 stop:15339 length:1542 start_codon:yes stop_codon:yes gene_type:complete